MNRLKKSSEYDKEIPQSHTADQLRHLEEDPQKTECHKPSGRQPKQSNQLFLLHQDDCKTRRTQSTDIKPMTKHKTLTSNGSNNKCQN